MLRLCACGFVGLFLLPGRAEADRRPETITLVVVGDVGLNRNQLQVHNRGVLEGGGVLTWSEMTEEVGSLIDGDLNFMNLETVVTDRNDLPHGDKRQKSPYLFRTHPKGVEHLVKVGFNLISAANNHAYDYGVEGVRETIKHLRALEKKRGVRFAGIGMNRTAAAAPSVFSVRGARVAFGAIGIVTNMLKFHRATDQRPGTLGYRYEEDWKLVTGALSKAKAGLKVLSVHYGRERETQCDEKQVADYRWALREQDVDVVVGHHAHVVRGIELHQGKVIFYGLGNFLIRGARDMRSQKALRVCCDYGLLAKVHLQRKRKGGYQARAIEVTPIVDMHRKARRWELEQSKKRVEVLNVLAEPLDDAKNGSTGIRFQIRDDGSGLWCAKNASKSAASIAKLCGGYRGPSRPTRKTRARVKRGRR